MHRKILISFLGVVLLSFACKSQSFLEKDINGLHTIIYKFIEKRDAFYKGRKSEFVLMVLEMDTAGLVKDIHLLADKKNVDSSCTILERMIPRDFMGQRFTSWKDKTISLPVYSIASTRNYVERSVVHFSSTIESKRTLMISPLYYLTPADWSRKEEGRVNMFIRLDSLSIDCFKADSTLKRIVRFK